MGCGSSKTAQLQQDDTTKVTNINQQPLILVPVDKYPIEDIQRLSYQGQNLFLLRIKGQFIMPQSIVLSFQSKTQLITFGVTVINCTDNFIEFYIMNPQFDFSLALVSNLDTFQSNLAIENRNVCFIGHGPGQSLIHKLGKKHGILTNFFILSSHDEQFLEQIEDSVRTNISQNQHPIYELMRLKLQSNQVVVVGPIWLLKMVRVFCIKYKIQGYGLLMLYSKYNKKDPIKWIDLNNDEFIANLQDSDQIEQNYFQNQGQLLLQRINHANNLEQLIGQSQYEGDNSDSILNHDILDQINRQSLPNTLQSTHDDDVMKKLKIFEEFALGDMDKKPASAKTNKGVSEADAIFSGQNTPTYQKNQSADNLQLTSKHILPDQQKSQPQLNFGEQIEFSDSHNVEKTQDNSSAPNKNTPKNRKSVKVLPTFQSSFVQDNDENVPEVDLLSHAIEEEYEVEEELSEILQQPDFDQQKTNEEQKPKITRKPSIDITDAQEADFLPPTSLKDIKQDIINKSQQILNTMIPRRQSTDIDKQLPPSSHIDLNEIEEQQQDITTVHIQSETSNDLAPTYIRHSTSMMINEIKPQQILAPINQSSYELSNSRQVQLDEPRTPTNQSQHSEHKEDQVEELDKNDPMNQSSESSGIVPEDEQEEQISPPNPYARGVIQSSMLENEQPISSVLVSSAVMKPSELRRSIGDISLIPKNNE